MPNASPAEWYSYAIIRVVPRVERGEFINAGVVLLVRATGYLAACTALDAERLLALDPDVEVQTIEKRLDAFRKLAAADPAAGPLAQYPPPERFHWLTTPRSTIIQPSPVHAGWTEDPAAELKRLMQLYVLRNHSPSLDPCPEQSRRI